MEKFSAELLSKYLSQEKGNGELSKQIISLSQLVAKRFTIILAAKDPIHNSKSEEIKDEMIQIAKEIDIKTIIKEAVQETSIYGDFLAIPSIDNEGLAVVKKAERKFTYKVVRYNNDPIYALVWTAISMNRVEYRIREVIDFTKVERSFIGQGNRFIQAESFNAQLPSGIFVKELEIHDLGVLPVEQFFNFDTLDFTQPSKQSDLAAAPEIQAKLDNSTFAWQREERNNITRLFLDQGYLDGLNEQQQLQAMDADLFIGLDGTDSKDGALPITVLQGDPKLTMNQSAVETVLELASLVAGIDIGIKDTKGDGTATGIYMGKGADIETINMKLGTLQKHLRRLMVKLYHMKNGIKLDRKTLLDFDYDISIVPNLMTDEIAKTDTLIKQVQAGLISQVKAKMSLDGISEELAEEELKDAEILMPAVEGGGQGEDKGGGNPSVDQMAKGKAK